SIAAVNIDSGKVNAHLADAQGAHVALPIFGGEKLLITHGKANQVTINDAKTGAVLTSIATDTNPDAAVLDPDTGDVFVMANHGATVDVIDPKALTLIAKIPMKGAPESAAVDGRGRMFTHPEDKDSIAVIDTKAKRVKAIFPMKDCQEPSGIA